MSSDALPTTQPKVLLVDDDRDLVDLIRDYLGRDGAGDRRRKGDIGLGPVALPERIKKRYRRDFTRILSRKRVSFHA